MIRGLNPRRYKRLISSSKRPDLYRGPTVSYSVGGGDSSSRVKCSYWWRYTSISPVSLHGIYREFKLLRQKNMFNVEFYNWESGVPVPIGARIFLH
jgi:hypothetical protein